MTAELIGRQDELALLEEFLDGVPAGPCALLVRGEAGIGKTTLWQAGLGAARLRSQRVLSCRPAGSEAQLSFAALGDLLDGVLEEALPGLPAPQRRALKVALLLEEAEGAPPDPRALALAFLAVLRSLAETAPVIVAVDDTQWLDRPSAASLEFVARRLREEPVGLVLAQRTEGTGEAPLGLERALPAERLRHLTVGPLSLEALHRLLRARLGTTYSRPTLLRLAETSGGNPFYALEIARALLRSGIEPTLGAALPVPPSLGELVWDRLAHLPARTREALLAASAQPQSTVASVAAALGARAGTSRVLARAVEAGVIAIEADRVRFTHPLLASVLYSGTPPEQRRRLHRRLAEVVGDPEESARHLALAIEGPDARVASALDEAAVRARARGAPEAAAELSELARRLTPSERAGDARRRTMQAAEYQLQAGDTARARILLEESVEASAHGHDRSEALFHLAEITSSTTCGRQRSSSRRRSPKHAMTYQGGPRASRASPCRSAGCSICPPRPCMLEPQWSWPRSSEARSPSPGHSRRSA